MLSLDDEGLRPLAGISRLSSMPAESVVLTDSPEAYRAASTLLTGLAHVHYTFPVQSVDWGGLVNRDVILVPSAGRDSQLAAEWVANRIRGTCKTLKLAAPESTRVGGWSLAAAATEGWSSKDAFAWIRKRAKPVIKPAPEPEPDHPALREGPPPDDEGEPDNEPPQLSAVPLKARPADPPEPPPHVLDEFSEEAQAAAEKFSEISLSDMFVRHHCTDWRHIGETGKWVQWRRDGWYEDKTEAIRAASAALVREANHWPDVSDLKASMRRSLCSAKTVASIVSLSGANPAVAMTLDKFDANPWLIGVPGGAVDLQTGKVIPANRHDYITRRTAVAPVDGPPKLWLDHLQLVFGGDDEKIGFLRRYLGYMLTGLVRDHALVFLYGGGGNGKGTIVETFVKTMGDYGYAAPVNLMMESKNDRHPTELAALRGKRSVSCSEPPTGSRWDDGRIRSLTGGDTVTARLMGENFSSFSPTHKLIVMGNHKPVLRSVDEAIKRRFHILDFSVTIPAEKRDTKFGEKLMQEAGQILNWAIQGCLEWQQIGLAAPESMRMATDDYLSGEDLIGQFIDDRFTRDPKSSILSAEVYRAYQNWAEINGEKPLACQTLVRMMCELPGISRGRMAGMRAVFGIKKRFIPVEQDALNLR